MSEQKLNLFQRLNAVRAEVEYIQKDKSVSAGAGGNYMAVTHDQVTAMTRGALVKHGVLILPSLVASKMSPPHKADGKQWLYEATYDFKFCNVDDRSDFEVVRIEAHATDNGDKAPGKALSYAKKNAVLKVLDLEAGESDESRYQEEFDITPHITAIEACADLEALKTAFAAAEKAANEARDGGALKVLTTAKNAKGAAIQKAMPMSEEKFQSALAKVKSGAAKIQAFDAYTLTDRQQGIIADMKTAQE